jgi:hypothetical protein
MRIGESLQIQFSDILRAAKKVEINPQKIRADRE